MDMPTLLVAIQLEERVSINDLCIQPVSILSNVKYMFKIYGVGCCQGLRERRISRRPHCIVVDVFGVKVVVA